MKRFLITPLLLIAISLTAQQHFTISGIIKDQSNGETLIGATAYIDGTTIGTTTNTYGFFSLTCPAGNHKLVISYMGYTTYEKEINLSENKKINVDLTPSASELDEVVVTDAESPKVNISTPQMSVNELTSKEIRHIPSILGESDVIQAIQLLPGVTSAGEGASGFNVRGGAEDQNLVLLDEAIIYNSSHLFGFFSVFNADVVKDLKLYKGGIPASYGGRASSVLDMRQKEGNSNNFDLTGGIGLLSSRLAIEGPTFKDRGSFIVAGRTSYAHLFLPLMDIDNSAMFYDVNFKTNFTINENNRLFLSGYLGNDDFDLDGIFSNSYGNISGTLRWNHIFSNKLFSNLSLILSRYNYYLKFDQMGMDMDSDIINYNLKYDFGYYISNNLRLDFGVSGIYYDFDPGKIQPTTDDSQVNLRNLDHKYAFESGIYASLEQKIGARLTMQYGLRYSYFSRIGEQTLNVYENDLPVVYNEEFKIYERANPIGEIRYGNRELMKSYGNFEPRLAMSVQLNNKSSIKASYNRIAQYLHLISNTTSATPLDIWAPSGTFIDPQIANQFAVGYFRNFGGDMLSLETEVYYKTIENRVDYINGAELIAQNHIETEILEGEARAYGIEFILRKYKGKLTGWLAYTLSRAEQRTPGGDAGGPGLNNGDWYNSPYDRRHDISFTGIYRMNDKWSFGANFAFQTGRPVTYPNGQFIYQGMSVPTYSSRNADRLPAYHRLDVSATLTPRKNKNRAWQSQWVFGIYNVYNRQNAASITFGQDIETGANEAVQTSIFGIIPAVTYNFKF